MSESRVGTATYRIKQKQRNKSQATFAPFLHHAKGRASQRRSPCRTRIAGQCRALGRGAGGRGGVGVERALISLRTRARHECKVRLKVDGWLCKDARLATTARVRRIKRIRRVRVVAPPPAEAIAPPVYAEKVGIFCVWVFNANWNRPGLYACSANPLFT